jgi:SAM-dependent methyltransferase
MNRKQRRASGHSGAGSALGLSAGSAPGAKAARMFEAAVAHHRAGALAKAERQYREILELFPSHAEAQSRIGAVLMAQGKTTEAIHHLERAIALKPDLFEALGNLAQAYLAAGRNSQAAIAALRALELRETAPGRTLFAHCARYARFTADKNGRVRKLMVRALAEGWAPPRALTGVCLSLIKLNGAVNDGVGQVDAAWPARLPPAELFGRPAMAEVYRDPLLCCLLTFDPITDMGFERLLGSVRHAMLTLCTTKEEWDERLLDFFCAVARQCFINEYVYSLTEAEAVRARELKAALVEKIQTGEPVPALWPVTVAAYFPLHSLPGIESLCDRPWPASIAKLLTQQIREPAQERAIEKTIPALTAIEDEVSRAVRQQYEENPYPRWVKTVPPEKTPDSGARPAAPIPELLIAGCGTGLSLVEVSRAVTKAHVLAVDLSRASLSYAKRMAQKLGLTGVEFAQADIAKLGSIGRSFDFIDASGVLHHMRDPWQGWRVLLSLLREGGTMQVGLYSELARRNVVAARALIAERGYRPTPQDIRRCREDIVASADPLLQSLTNGHDFYTTSECRDLLFHVQEHRITLPEIKSFLAANNLSFAGFILMPAVTQKFAARFPARAALTDLDCWHTFETEAPDTFAEMYQFQVQKPARSQGTQPL